MKKSSILLFGAIALLLTITGVSYAFFYATNNNSDVGVSGAAKEINTVEYVPGTSLNIPESGIYPGWIGVQDFQVVVPDGVTSGTGTYEIVLETNIHEDYGDWITYELYKTTDYSNTITRVEGTLSDDIYNLYVDDSLTPNGFTIPDAAIASGIANNTSGDISVDKVKYDLSTFEDTKYYLVIRFLNEDLNQNAAINKYFEITIKMKQVVDEPGGNDYEDPTIAGNDPVLDSKLVPVLIEEGTGVVTIADTSQEWYNYTNSEWANAVIVNDNTYLTASAGTVIPMESIEQMYVWIPRYEYKKSSIVNASESIEINFVPISTVNTDIENNDVIVHPAFTFGGVEQAGIWVGKFEMGFNDGESESTANVEYIIKPNVNSVHSTNVSTMYDKINNAMTTYSMDATTDVHMMKNTEWGAVAYLSQSKYGICEDDITCSVRMGINNYFNNVYVYDIVTGCGDEETPVANNVTGIEICPASNRWETESGVNASTTHNITGIYDMAGGRWEYVMGNMQDSSGDFYSSKSGFTTAPDAKYYDSYAHSSSATDYTRGLYGDATTELNISWNPMTNWNSDSASFVVSSHSWFIRGGNSNDAANAGIFAFNYSEGYSYKEYSARSVLLLAAQ